MMDLLGTLRRWREDRILRTGAIGDELWDEVIERHPFLSGLPNGDLDRLRRLAIMFLHEKPVHGASGLEVDDHMRVSIAVQACLVVLNLGLDYYRGWVEIIVYPGEFLARFEFTDEDGVVHEVEEAMSGESWERGPVILSWQDAREGGAGDGYNVVIHEFAHKIDMLNGPPDGFPPLPADMTRAAWTAAFTEAYEDFCRRVDAGVELPLDDYAAENPAEFFAVASEGFFECPSELRRCYPDVYAQLQCFYRQDPASRIR
jgi:Mlc titration factor MtfA (ptsG expression regulator)